MNRAPPPPGFRPTRRQLLASGAAATLIAGLCPRSTAAAPVLPEILAATGGKTPSAGRVKIAMPQISENGNTVPISITVDSPMTAAIHVAWIGIFAPRNPVIDVARFHLGPRAGRARVATNMRLAITQDVQVVAAISDGTFWTAHQEVLVTIGACLDGGM